MWPQTIEFLARTGIDLSPLVTKTYSLSDADQAIQTVLDDKSQVKVHYVSEAS